MTSALLSPNAFLLVGGALLGWNMGHEKMLYSNSANTDIKFLFMYELDGSWFGADVFASETHF